MSNASDDNAGEDIWLVLERGAPANAGTAQPAVTQAANPPKPTTRWSRLKRWTVFRFLNALAVVAWLYVFLKLFIFDVDHALVTAVPLIQPLLDFRVLVFLFLIALIAVFFWHLKALGAVAFVVFYPFVVTFWKVPNLAHKLRLDQNWVFWMLLFQGVIAGFRNLRFMLLCATFGLASALVILLFAQTYLLVPASLVLVGLLIWTVARVVTASMRTSSFLTSQKKALDSVASFGERFVKVELPPRDAGGTLTLSEVQALSLAIVVRLVANRALYLWAYKLQQYRQSSLGLLLSLAGYCLLFVGSVFTLGLVNLALLKSDPGQFTFSTFPSALSMMLYGLSSLFRTEGGGVAAGGELAYLLQLIAGIYGPLLLSVFVLSAVITVRGAREDRDLRRTVSELRARARAQEADLTAVLRVGIDEALERMRRLGFAWLLFVYDFFRRNIPADFIDEDATAKKDYADPTSAAAGSIR